MSVARNIDKEEMKNPMEGKKVIFVENSAEPENADGARGHLEAIGESDTERSIYDRFWKREAYHIEPGVFDFMYSCICG